VNALLQLMCMPAGSSGVPEVMGFLNGSVVHNQFSLAAFVVKFISCAAGVSAGLPIGPEGPMVTIGFVSALILPASFDENVRSCSLRANYRISF